MPDRLPGHQDKIVLRSDTKYSNSPSTIKFPNTRLRTPTTHSTPNSRVNAWKKGVFTFNSAQRGFSVLGYYTKAPRCEHSRKTWVMSRPGPGCSKSGLCYPPDKSLSIQWIAWFVLLTLILWIAIYPVYSVIQP